ncbi:MAG TPA: hypothetical protein VN697_11275 [Tepidiformaceae bacterium]|nr:hypothetical protein [Tepidiformaceae bacterium]
MAEETVIVAESADRVEAEIWLDALRSAGIPAAIFERGPGAAMGGAMAPAFARYPVLVSRSNFAPARNVIADMAGGSALSPVRDSLASSRASLNAVLVMGVVAVGIIVVGVLFRVVAG